MSETLDDQVNCDVCGRMTLLWNMLNVIPEDDTYPVFGACIWCVRAFNTLVYLTDSSQDLAAEFEWTLPGRRESMPSSVPYYPAAADATQHEATMSEPL